MSTTTATPRQLAYLRDLADQLGKRTGRTRHQVYDDLGAYTRTGWGDRPVPFTRSTASRAISTVRARLADLPPSDPYPYVDSTGRTVWACCVSSIGPTCQHLAGTA